MNIVSVRFKNIASFQGDWEIHFDRPPLSDTRLFAIVGPNGSGKTTILDAITLALYGETPRTKDPEHHLMHWEAADCYAEVTFSVGDEFYRSRWSVGRAGGRPGETVMALFSLNGGDEVLEDRVIKVRERVAELTGLDFKRFCRSILLAQGEFSSFLDALESERSEILEKIIGPELSHELVASLSSRIQAENDKIFLLKEAVAANSPPDRRLIQSTEELLDQVEEKRREAELLLKDLEEREALWDRREALISEEHHALAALQSVEAEAARVRDELDRVQRVARVEHLGEGVLQYTALQQEADRAEARLTKLRADIHTYGERMGDLKRRLQENRQEKEQAEERLEARKDEIQKAVELDAEINVLGSRFLEDVSRYEALERSVTEKTHQHADLEKRLGELEGQRGEVAAWVEAHAADAGLEAAVPLLDESLNRLEDVRRRAREQEALQADTRKAEERAADELKRAADKLQAAGVRLEALSERKAGRDGRISELLENEPLEVVQERYRNVKVHLSVLKELAGMAQKHERLASGEDPRSVLTQVREKEEELIQSLQGEEARLAELEEKNIWSEALTRLSEERVRLEFNKPCPLCGALDHPFIEQGVPDCEAEDRALRDQRGKVQAILEELGTLKNKAGDVAPKVKAMESLERDWNGTCEREQWTWSITDPSSVQDELRATREMLNDLKSRLSSVRWEKWRSIWGEYSYRRRVDKHSRKAKELDHLREVHSRHAGVLAELDSSLEELRREEEAVRSTFQATAHAHDESLSQTGEEAAILERIKQRAASYRRQLRELEAFPERIESLSLRHDALPSELERLKAEAADLAVVIESNQQRMVSLKEERGLMAGDHDPVQEKQALESVLAASSQQEPVLLGQMEELRKAAGEWREELPQAERAVEAALESAMTEEMAILEDAASAEYSSIVELQDDLALLERRDSITEKWHAVQKALPEARKRHGAARAALDEAGTPGAGKISREVLQGRIAEAAKVLGDLREEESDARRTLKQYRDADRRHAEAVSAVADQEKVAAHLAAEERSLSSGDSAAVRERLRRLMFERLLQRANDHLEGLNGRYRLRPGAEEGFGIHVEDSLQAGKCRYTKSLSGGELFQVSLCLALGLAEMAGRDRKIESLFLDEGFGSLDDEMLYKVMAALKNLQANGKRVGVISHVKRLADEIPTQIRLEKLRGGRSSLTVTA